MAVGKTGTGDNNRPRVAPFRIPPAPGARHARSPAAERMLQSHGPGVAAEAPPPSPTGAPLTVAENAVRLLAAMLTRTGRPAKTIV